MSQDFDQETPALDSRDGAVPRLGLGQRAAFILFEAALIPVAFGVGWLLGVRPLATFFWDFGDALWGAIVAAALVAGVIVAVRFPITPWRSLVEMADRLLGPLFSNWTLLELAAISALAGIGEEMLFRGVAQEALGNWLGVSTGLVAASLLFGLVHFLSWQYALFAAVIGAILGLLWLATGNLLAPMLAHGLYDLAVLVYLVRMRAAPGLSGGEPESNPN